MNTSRPYLLNDVDFAVKDNLIGLVSSHQHLKLLKDSTIVIRADLEEVISKGHVCLVSGCGSGHEPGQAGFLGPGMLTAAIHGHIFASPSSKEVFRLIRYLNTRKTPNVAGVLIIIPNYTGDRLNFGVAKEQADCRNFKTDILIFGDDCAFKASPSDRIGRRGLAGIFFLHKVAGALAERGLPLEQLKDKLLNLAPRIGSMSVSLTSCSIPGTGSSFSLPSGQMEIGLGIHGERGVKREPIKSAREVVKIIIDSLFSKESTLSMYLKNGKTERTPIAVLFNDNGGLTSMEMNIIIKETLSELSNQGFVVKMQFSGRFVTSFDMVGICVSVMVLDDEILELLLFPCSTPIVSVENCVSHIPNSPECIFLDDEKPEDEKFSHDRILKENAEIVHGCLTAVAAIFSDHENFLNHLDGQFGDSDCGSTMKRGALGIIDKSESFEQLAAVVETCMGGTSGALYGLFFKGASKAVKNNSDQSDIWIKIIESGIENISKYSYARPGDCSMVDPLDALLQLLKSWKSEKQNHQPNSSPIPNEPSSDRKWEKIISTVKKAAESTVEMQPKVGRAAYSGKGLEKNRPDPGAYAVYLWVMAICNHLQKLEICW